MTKDLQRGRAEKAKRLKHVYRNQYNGELLTREMADRALRFELDAVAAKFGPPGEFYTVEYDADIVTFRAATRALRDAIVDHARYALESVTFEELHGAAPALSREETIELARNAGRRVMNTDTMRQIEFRKFTEVEIGIFLAKFGDDLPSYEVYNWGAIEAGYHAYQDGDYEHSKHDIVVLTFKTPKHAEAFAEKYPDAHALPLENEVVEYLQDEEADA